ncbi:hypothetical protein BJ742DRAFT_788433 [Cladochytrium replicatum]|nr:hypothetical protein BJ742DRAFT_788433 [Cladochytrium replicatum]
MWPMTHNARSYVNESRISQQITENYDPIGFGNATESCSQTQNDQKDVGEWEQIRLSWLRMMGIEDDSADLFGRNHRHHEKKPEIAAVKEEIVQVPSANSVETPPNLSTVSASHNPSSKTTSGGTAWENENRNNLIHHSNEPFSLDQELNGFSIVGTINDFQAYSRWFDFDGGSHGEDHRDGVGTAQPANLLNHMQSQTGQATSYAKGHSANTPTTQSLSTERQQSNHEANPFLSDGTEYACTSNQGKNFGGRLLLKMVAARINEQKKEFDRLKSEQKAEIESLRSEIDKLKSLVVTKNESPSTNQAQDHQAGILERDHSSLQGEGDGGSPVKTAARSSPIAPLLGSKDN